MCEQCHDDEKFFFFGVSISTTRARIYFILYVSKYDYDLYIDLKVIYDHHNIAHFGCKN